MAKTKIEWAQRVWNPVTGCTPISPGCKNCYAERMSKRFAEQWGLPADNPFKVILHPERLEEPLRWKKAKRIFVCSMSDLFHEDVPDDFIIQAFSTMANAQWFYGHIFMVLTKRPDRMKKIIEAIKADIEKQRIPIKNDNGTTTHRITFAFPLENIWLGVTAENQEQADKRIPILLETPAVKRFVSVEPMLGPINLSRYLKWPICKHWGKDGDPNVYGKYHWEKQSLVGNGWKGLDWVICGGESGPGARPMHPDWIRNLRDQCQASEVPFLFKQWGEWAPYIDEDKFTIGDTETTKNMQHYVNPEGSTGTCWISDGDGTWQNWTGKPEEHCCVINRVGKKKAGRSIDGRIWNEYPKGANP